LPVIERTVREDESERLARDHPFFVRGNDPCHDARRGRGNDRRTGRIQRRIELYTQFQNIIVDELPETILDFPQGFTGVSNRVHNVYPSGVNARFNMQYWWVEQ